MRSSQPLAGLAAVLLVLSAVPAALAQPVAQAQTLTIGVDYADPANQQPDQHRFFEYIDFFPRSVNVHSGDTLDFRVAPGAFHVIGLAPSDSEGRAAYPVGGLDTEDPVLAIGTGLPKIQLGPGNFSVTGGSTTGGGSIGTSPEGPPVCGAVQLNQPACTFAGGHDVELAGPLAGFDPQAGQPVTVDWKIAINAPAGTYSYLCWIHPRMTGHVTVVGADQAATTQAEIDGQSAAQFAAERDQALAMEQSLQAPVFSGGAPGRRTYEVIVGTETSDGYVQLNEMLPQTLQIARGDRVDFAWRSANEVHTVSFPADDPRLNSPFGYDCGTTFQSPPQGPPTGGQAFQPCLEPGLQAPELIGDPGTSPSGTALTDPTQLVDAGLLVGTGYGFGQTTQHWSMTTTAATQSGIYQYECTVHEGMHGVLQIGTGPAVQQPAAQVPATK